MNRGKIDRFFYFLVIVGSILSLVLFFVHTDSKIVPTGEQLGVSVEKDFLYSFFDNKSDYDESFNKVRCGYRTPIVAGIVTHHYLAKDMIAEFYACVDPTEVRNVILVSPDHFNRLMFRDVQMVSSYLRWETPYGIIDSDKSSIEALVKREDYGIEIDDVAFMRDHGIYTSIPFIKWMFPNSQVMPLIVSNNLDYDEAFRIGSILYESGTILVASVDFSHYSTIQESKINDLGSISSLEDGNIDGIDEITSDCNSCIAVLYGFIDQLSSDFMLVDNKTAIDFGGITEDNLTSYVVGYFVEK